MPEVALESSESRMSLLHDKSMLKLNVAAVWALLEGGFQKHK